MITSDNPYIIPPAVLTRDDWPRQFEMTTATTDLNRVRLMYAMLNALSLSARLEETAEMAVVRCNCTAAQWSEALHHVEIQSHLKIGVP